MAEALYRKYRPQVFADVVGQEPIERTLRNAIEQGKVSHAYLFCGPRGTGKTTTARLLAKALLCENGPTPDPDGTCEDCRLIADGVHPDVYELDAASRTGVENVREEILSRVQFAPTRGRYKVYIIDEVHMLSTAAFNALLKTLEEPPSHVVFILCTTDPQKVLETVHSRCQRFDFRRIAPESMVSRLGAICVAEGVEFEGEALDLIAHRADGGLRNALTSLEQIIAFENGKVTLEGAERLLGSIDANDMAEIISYIGRRDIANCLRWTSNYVETGADLAQFVRDMAEHVRNMYVLALAGDEVGLDVSETVRRELVNELQWFGPERLARLMGVLGDLTAELKTSSNARLSFEIALTRMVRPDSDLTLEALAERIEALESGYSAVAHVLPGEPLARGYDAPMQAHAAAAPLDAYAASAAAAVAAPAAVSTAAAPVAAEVAPAAGGRLQGESVQSRVTSGASDMSMQATSAAQASAEAQQAAIAAAASAAASVAAAPAARTASAVAGSGDMAVFENPAAFQRVWQAALGILKKQKAAYGVLFLNTKARFNGEAGRVEVEFPVENGFAFMTVQKSEVREVVEASLAQAAGQTLPIVFLQSGGQAASATATVPAATAAVAATAPVAVAQIPASEPAPIRQSEPMRQSEPAFEPMPDPAPEPVRQPAFEPAPEPVRQLEPELEPVIEPEPEPMPASAPASVQSFDEPFYDPVPYDEFDEYGGYDYEPYDEMSSFPSSLAPEEPAAQPQPQPQSQPAPASDAPLTGMSDLQAMLQAGFGDGITFIEVDE